MSAHSHGDHAWRNPYSKYWVPFLFWLGEKTFGGRLHAGKASHDSRLVRFAANAVSLAVIAQVMAAKSVETFINEGAEMPLYAIVITTLAMAVNMLAVLVGSAANHHKIQQYYDAEITWQELDNLKTGKKNAVPHGLHAPSPILKMQAVRYLHDANGLGGSAVSAIIFVAYASELLGVGIGLSLFVVGAMFMASRASALLSVISVPFTTRYRLNVYKDQIADQAHAYCQRNPHAEITATLKKIPLFYHVVSREEKLLYASCYRACENFLARDPQGKMDSDKIMTVLKKYVNDRQYIVIEHMKNQSAPVRVPFMDALQFIETDILTHLSGREKAAKIPVDSDPASLLLSEKLKARGVSVGDASRLPNMVENPLTHHWQINKAAVCQQYKTESNPHGTDQFVLGYHTEKMVAGMDNR